MMWKYLFLVLSLTLFLTVDCRRRRRRQCQRRRFMVHDGHRGIIETFGYPEPYATNQICLWHIKVPPGYTVHIDFHDKFGIYCTSKDKLVVSSIQLSYDREPKGSSHTVEVCGVSNIYNITAPQRDLWLRFRAHKNATGAIGFRITYTAVDVDECKRNHKCQNYCTNTPGSYRCSCPRGFKLAPNGRNCTIIPRYNVTFSKTEYNIKISRLTQRYSRVMKLQAKVNKKNVRITYSLERKYPKPKILPIYPFRLSSRTGIIKTIQDLPGNINSYQLVVKAEVNSESYTETTINIEVVDPSINIVKFKFSKPRYSVIISDNLQPRRTALHLSVSPRSASPYVMYSIREKPFYFNINQSTGAVLVQNDLSLLKLTDSSSKRFQFTVIATHREQSSVTSSAVITVIVIPAFSGDKQSRRPLVENEDINKEVYGKNSRQRRPKEFSFHRFFRQLSPQARAISKAEMKFSKTIKILKESVVEAFTDPRLRSSDPISTNLDTISLTSRSKLQEIINSTHCVVPKADCSDTDYHMQYRSFDGTCNNLEQPLWGAANVPFNRLVEASYWDEERLGEPAGFPGQLFPPDLPSPHLISERYVIHRQYPEKNTNRLSHMMMQWGQFLDHDITFTAESEGSENCGFPRCDGTDEDYEAPCFPILYADKRECTMFTRSAAACQSDPKNIKPREQLNTITSYIDGSQVYGSSLQQANSLRYLKGDQGFLKMNKTGHLLPELEDILNPPLNLCHFSGGCFAAGDLRANEQVVLASMHTLWVREHNRLAAFLKHHNPKWDSEKIFQEARKIVIAKLQHITYTEYLPKLLGKNAIPPYSGYKKDVDATIYNVFATSAFRAGHSMVRPGFSVVDKNYDPLGPDLPLMNAFFNNKLIYKDGIQPLLLGLLANVSQPIDRGMAEGLTKHLFQQPGGNHGFNLAALNIQRGRDHGLPGYGAWRRECYLDEAVFFDETQFEITDSKVRAVLDELYNGVEHADLWVAGLAEDPIDDAIVGPTFRCILSKQFTRLRDGDRFWYEKPGVFTKEQLKEIKKVTLSKVLCDNLYGMVSVQKDVFYAATNDTQRVGCFFGLPPMNMSLWKESETTKDREGTVAEASGFWSPWILTTKLSTGSWATYDQYKVCQSNTVMDIECEANDDEDEATLKEDFTCDKDIGFYCRNIEQETKDTICSDYKFRILCSKEEKAVPAPKLEVTGYPSTGKEIFIEADPTLLASVTTAVRVSATVEKEATIYSPTKRLPGSEYLYLGKEENDAIHRILLKFNLARINRGARVFSAHLHLYMVSATNQDGQQNSLHNIEVYRITSTDWHPSNVSSVIPWNEDYLGLHSDVDKESFGTSEQVNLKEEGKWVTIDINDFVHQWRISRKPNYGVMIKLADEAKASTLIRFVSNAHSNVALRPKLTVFLALAVW